MEHFIIPPSPSWQLSKALACNDDGILALASRNEISIITTETRGKFEVSFINQAHKEKVKVLVFSPSTGSFKGCLASCGDDGVVNVWNFRDAQLLYCHTGHKDGISVNGLDWSRADLNRLVSVNDLGSIVVWDLLSNTIRRLHCGIKSLPLCLACSPHDKDLVAIGCKGGVTLVIDIGVNGKLIHRLRGQEQDVISVSWCPVPFNVIKHKGEGDGVGTNKQKGEFLLATGGMDQSVHVWRAGRRCDGRYQALLTLPNTSVNSTNSYRKKGHSPTLYWTCVHWVDAYTLLSTSQFGELLAWDLRKVPLTTVKVNDRPQPRLLHSKHNKGCFSIACPVTFDVLKEWKSDKRVVWTTAMDKHLIACSLGSGKVVLDIPTFGGQIISLALSPLDPNRLAIGSSDSKVFLWNMSDIASLNISTYWKNIVGKVMALCWHPVEENILAFGTSDGHVGLLDVGAFKPTLLRLHHRKAVYRLCWAPPLIPITSSSSEKSEAKASEPEPKKQLALFSLGDGDVFQYDLQNPNQVPLSLNSTILDRIDRSQGLKKSLIRSDMAFKPDLSCFAIGSENGSVYIVKCENQAAQHVLFPHKKLMNNLEWHPQTVASENEISPYKDWLAASCENIKVYNIPPVGSEGTPELVATLSGHSLKVVGLAWSPHHNGRLVSASYDYTVQVWDVPSHSCLGVYTGHSWGVMSVLFSPRDPETVISASADHTLQIWPLSKLSAPAAKPDKKKDRLDVMKKQRSEVQNATELTVGMSVISSKEEEEETKSTKETSYTSSGSPTHTSTHKGTEDFKKRLKSRAVFTVTGSALAQARHFEELYRRWGSLTHSPLPSGTVETDSASVSPTRSSSPNPSTSDLGYLDFFGDSKAMNRLLMVEESHTKQHSLSQQSMMWRGDVSKMIQEAITKKQMSDWLVAMAPIAGFDVWETACDAFASQLVEGGEVPKASTYLLATHKVNEAVRLLTDHKFFREAIAIAKCRLSNDDPLICEVYTAWGDAARHQGNLPLAAHCYLAANNMQVCVDTLARTKDLRSLAMAAMLASQTGLNELANSLALECLTLSVVACNHAVGYHLITQMPQYQYWSVWLKSSELLSKVKNRSETEVFNWLEGQQPGQFSLVEELTTMCTSVGPVYHQLLPHLSTSKTPEFERDMWCYVSGQIAVACAAKQEASPVNFLRHLVLALSAGFHFQTSHPASLALPLTLSVIAPTGLLTESSILKKEYTTNEEKQLMKSLKAFASASIINWMYNNLEKVKGLMNKAEEEEKKEGSSSAMNAEGLKMRWLPELLESCSADLLDFESKSFFMKKAMKQELQNVVAQENIQVKCNENKSEVENKQIGSSKSKGKTATAVNKSKTDDQDAQKKELASLSSCTNEIKEVDENLNLTNEISQGSANKTIFLNPSVEIDLKENGSNTETSNLKLAPVVEKLKCPIETHVDKPDIDTNGKSLEVNKESLNKSESSKTIDSNGKCVEVNSKPLNKADSSKTADTNGKNVEVNEESLNKSESSKIIDSNGKCDEVNSKPLNKSESSKTVDTNGKCVEGNSNPLNKSDSSKTIDKPNINSISKSVEVNGDPINKSVSSKTVTSIGNVNCSENNKRSTEGIDQKMKEIKELDKVLSKFEADRVAAPSPFTAYMNIKYLIDNLVSKQDEQQAQRLQEACDLLWQKSDQ